MENINTNHPTNGDIKANPDATHNYKADTTKESVEELVESIREKIQYTLEKKARNNRSEHR